MPSRRCTIVVAEHQSVHDVALVRRWAPPDCLVHVYSKSRSCAKIPPGRSLRCDELPNVGRDLGTHLRYVGRLAAHVGSPRARRGHRSYLRRFSHLR